MTPDTFFTQEVPEAWNALPPEPVSFSMRVHVEESRYHLRVVDGRMHADTAPTDDPLITLVLAAADFVKLAEEIGPSPMALLGGIGGDKDFALTVPRLEALRDVEGTLALRVVGDVPWGVVLHFGSEPVADAPDTTISIEAEHYRSVREGELDLQGAFMTGKLQLEGNVEAAMKLALALMTPA